jgi:hypothetical protein
LLIDRLTEGPRTTSDLCAGIAMSRFGVMKHIGVLERAGLLTARRHGRLRLNHLNAAPLHQLGKRWLSPRADRLGSIGANIVATAEEEGMSTSPEAVGIVHIAMDWEVDSSVQRLWQALFRDVDQWWPAGCRAVEASTFHFEERLGGRLLEEAKSGEAIFWYSVIALSPLRSLDLAGHLASRYGGPATSLLHIEIAPGVKEGTSSLKITDSVYGRVSDGRGSSLREGWEAIFGDGLKAYLEQSS